MSDMTHVNGSAPVAKAEHRGWIGVDLDGTLAKYDGWKGPEHIGEPVPEMVRKVKAMLAAGQEVRIFTARVWPLTDTTVAIEFPKLSDREITAWQAVGFIREWCEQHIGVRLPITCMKDYGMTMLYDDRCCYVFPNEGITHREHQGFLQAAFLDVATALGVRVEDGANFKAVADECAARARAGATAKAEQYQQVLAQLDGCEDAVRYAATSPALTGILKGDLTRALQQLSRALPMLRELAGK